LTSETHGERTGIPKTPARTFWGAYGGKTNPKIFKKKDTLYPDAHPKTAVEKLFKGSRIVSVLSPISKGGQAVLFVIRAVLLLFVGGGEGWGVAY